MTNTMNQNDLKKILESHAAWLRNDGGTRANLRGANLQEADLQRVDLRGANLQGASLQGASLQWASLQGASLQEANLQGVNLQEANLQGANLQWADLQGVNLQGANLQWADLQWVNLQEANLQEANLQKVQLPSPTMVLLASWGEVSNELTKRLMAFDAACHPEPERFNIWAETGECPYKNCHVPRVANFVERAHLWHPNLLTLRESPYNLMMAILKEKTKST
jgi:hypothetical protein